MTATTGQQWLLDLGNSRCKCARLDANGGRGEVLAMPHRGGVDVDRLRATVGPAAMGDIAWLASVAPASLTDAAIAALQALGYAVEIARTLPRCRRLRIAYATPAHLGVDRFLALLAASERGDAPCLLVSAGSAVTLDLLAADGRHLGGLIAPSAGAMRAILGQRIAQLDLPTGNVHEFADDTADAVASGAFAAVLGVVERSRRLAEQRLGVAPRLLLSGGDAEMLAAHLPFAVEHAPWLVLDGLAILARNGRD